MSKLTDVQFLFLDNHQRIKKLPLHKWERLVMFAINQSVGKLPPLREDLHKLINIHDQTLKARLCDLIDYGLLTFIETNGGRRYSVNTRNLLWFYKNGKPKPKTREDTVYNKYTQLPPDAQDRVFQKILDLRSTLIKDGRSTYVVDLGEITK